MWQYLTNNLLLVLNGPWMEKILAARSGIIFSFLLFECMRYERSTDYVAKCCQNLIYERVKIVERFNNSTRTSLRMTLFVRNRARQVCTTQKHRAKFPIVREDVEKHLTQFFDEFVSFLRNQSHCLDFSRLGWC